MTPKEIEACLIVESLSMAEACVLFVSQPETFPVYQEWCRALGAGQSFPGGAPELEDMTRFMPTLKVISSDVRKAMAEFLPPEAREKARP